MVAHALGDVSQVVQHVAIGRVDSFGSREIERVRPLNIGCARLFAQRDEMQGPKG